jgi:hypothetical protein
MRTKIFIGIDPGVKTGFAMYTPNKKTLELYTYKIHEAFDVVSKLAPFFDLEVVIEDPNQWTHFRSYKEAKAKLQGAGSVKRDFSAWRDFLTDWDIPFTAVRPDKQRNAYATNEAMFKSITGYQKRSSGHARVAAMLVYKK